jgi:Cro/C1-type HTH DNA-binding domain
MTKNEIMLQSASEYNERISKEYKYNLLYRLCKIPKSEYSHARIFLIKELNIHENTLNNWCYIRKNAKQSIPAEPLQKIASFFNCSLEELQNYSVPGLHKKWIDYKNDHIKQ